MAESKAATEVGFDKELDAVKAVIKAVASLGEEGRRFVLKTVADRLKIPAFESATSLPLMSPSIPQLSAPTAVGKMTAKQFLAAKRPTSDVERVACLAYYLTHGKAQPHFKTVDVTKLNTEAAGGSFSNPARSVNNATHQSGFLAAAGKGNKQITAHGEAIVNALPNREAVETLLADYKPGRRRSRKRKARSRK